MPKYGCITYDFDDDPFTDMEWNNGVKKMWERGMIPGIYSWFANPSGATFREHCDVDQIFTEGENPIKTNWYAQLDRMAENLKWLQDQGISVIYTPYVELDNRGKWFGTDGKANAIKLHRMIHDYFEQTKGLSNLIWAYHTGSKGNMKDFYPGDDYVDVMGHSVYHRWGNPPLDFYDYDWAVEKKKNQGKVIWMAELGINSQGEPPRDCFDVLKRLENDYPELAGFVFWSDAAYYNVVGNKNGVEFMEHPQITILE
jgi:mannan endo-1,4-beta-mannosidase